MSEATKPTPLELAQAKLAQMRADGIEVARLTPTEKALADPKSRHKAIRAMCYECLGGEDCPNIRDEIAYCTDWSCALWHLRPHQQRCADPSLWPHKHLDRANYGEPFGEEKRKAALGKANPQQLDDRMLISASTEPTSLRMAIRAKCLQCFGGKRKDITECPTVFKVHPGRTYVGCPLHPLRPYQTGRDDPETETEPETEDDDDFPTQQ